MSVSLARILAALALSAALQPAVALATTRCELLLDDTDFLERRLGSAQLAQLKLEPGEQGLGASVRSLLAAGDWNAPALDPLQPAYESLLRAALAEFEAGRLEQEQLATLILRWEAFRDFKVGAASGTQARVEPLLDERGELTPLARQMFSVDREGALAPATTALDADGLSRLTAALRALPKSERAVWIISFDPHEVFRQEPDKGWYGGYWSTRNLWTTSPFWAPGLQSSVHVDANPEKAGRETLTLPSFGAAQAYIDARFPGRGVKMMPEFGQTDENGVLEGIARGGRVFAVHFPKIGGLHQADWSSQATMVSVHDFHHALYGSVLPANYRRILPHLGAVVSADERLAEQIGDLKMNSSFRDYDAPLALRIVEDFGAGRVAAIMKDLAENPGFYEAQGVDSVKLLADLKSVRPHP